MPDEFTPEASVDFEALAGMAAAATGTNGDGPHFAPPPQQAPPTPPPVRPRKATAALDPFEALAQISGDQSLMYRELGDINAKLAIIQLQTILAFGAALLLAVLVWKFAKATE